MLAWSEGGPGWCVADAPNYVAVDYYDGEATAYVGDFYHDPIVNFSVDINGQRSYLLNKSPWATPSNKDKNSGRSMQDYLLGIEAIKLGVFIRTGLIPINEIGNAIFHDLSNP